MAGGRAGGRTLRMSAPLLLSHLLRVCLFLCECHLNQEDASDVRPICPFQPLVSRRGPDENASALDVQAERRAARDYVRDES